MNGPLSNWGRSGLINRICAHLYVRIFFLRVTTLRVKSILRPLIGSYARDRIRVMRKTRITRKIDFKASNRLARALRVTRVTELLDNAYTRPSLNYRKLT